MLRTDDAGRRTMDDGRWTMDAGPSAPYYKLTGELKTAEMIKPLWSHVVALNAWTLQKAHIVSWKEA